MRQRGSEWQLVLFTILTQMAVGTFILWSGAMAAFAKPHPFIAGTFTVATLGMVLAFLVLGTLSAGLHLGRPISAVFSIANLQRSWLSREALLGGSFGLVGLITLIRRRLEGPISVVDVTLIAVGLITGLALLYTISRLYMLRTVPAWNHLGTPAAFFTTSLLLGSVVISTLFCGLTFSNQPIASIWLNSGMRAISMAWLPLVAMSTTSIFS